MSILALSIIAGVITVLVMQLLAHRNRMGWLLSLANQPIWGLLIYLTEAWGLALISAAMIVTSIHGFRNWRPNDTR